MSQQVIDRVLIVGLGLIGGSLAASLKSTGFAGEVRAWGHREPSLIKGQALGLIDSYTTDLSLALDGADFVVIATPTLTANAMLAAILPAVAVDVVITDVASVKGSLVAEAIRVAGQVPPNFVPGHPIAGSEQSGVEAARADLFVNHRVILTPLVETDSAAVDQVGAMWASTGAEVLQMGVEEHDAILAATSHLPHVLAYALVDGLAGSAHSENIFRFAAGGFRDFTRIASSDPVMWRDIALANREQLLGAVDQFGHHLGRLRNAIEQSDGAALQDIFERAKQSRDDFAVELANRQTPL
ncbi:MAG: cyclohexadieny/prephenate dehydrogenase [Halieaceae bacterium]|jgi:cyclohexadieny/prephenate dehydrogenase